MKIDIKAKSSSGDPYTVEFQFEDNILTVLCNCKAGIHGTLCKHRTELLAGDESRLFDSSELPKLNQLTELISKSQEIKEIASQISESEKIIKQEQSKVRKIKKRFSDKLKKGITIK